MTLIEKSLYHQIHPLKLFTAGLIALHPFWRHYFLIALLTAFAPSMVVSFFLIRFADLEKYKQSGFGKYVREYMTRPIEAVRFLGYGIMSLGAWLHAGWLIPIGLLVIALAWLRGFLFLNK